MTVRQKMVGEAGERQWAGSVAEFGVPYARAARELELKPRELLLAVQLGEVRTVADGPGGRRRVPREEVGRHRAQEGFPDALRTRLRTVGTAEGAELLGISRDRFARLARGGCFAPVNFYVNRYRAVVWRYLASELVEFAEQNPEMLRGPAPALLRAALEKHPDRRARGWRARRLAQLTAQAVDPWECAAVPAAVLGPEDLAQAVPDPVERARLRALRPLLVDPRPAGTAVGEVVEELVTATDRDEAEWYRYCLALALDRVREELPLTAPWPGPGVPGPGVPDAGVPAWAGAGARVPGVRVRAAAGPGAGAGAEGARWRRWWPWAGRAR
ncbi:DUF6397 family protein [Streptomyces mashuensis]|nr:DUF6397 family protein [Streptomyces mashuensis]